MTRKTDYVMRAASRSKRGTHLCHGGCGKTCAPAFWGCRSCWFRLPSNLRDRIWKTYRPGQEIDKKPSAEYLAAADDVQKWIAANPLPKKPQQNLFGEAHG